MKNEKSLHEICVEAVNKMVSESLDYHVSYIELGDSLNFELSDGRIPKVTIEWVAESEAIG